MISVRPLNLATAIITSRSAAPRVEALARMLGLPEAVVEARAIEGHERGELEVWWERRRVTLSSIGAERLKVRIAGRGWIHIDRPDPTERVDLGRLPATTEADLVAGDARRDLARLLVDPTPGAELALETLEGAEAELAALAASRTGTQRRVLEPTYPRVVLGMAEQWPAAPWHTSADGPAPRRECPGCGAAPRLAEYCAICDRHGTDPHQPERPGVKRRRKRQRRRRVAAEGRRLAALAELLQKMAGG